MCSCSRSYPVASADTQAGGMSPGCAAQLVTQSGNRAFVKAVGAELSAQTPELFRHERHILSRLPRTDYRPWLLVGYDDDR